MTTTSRLSEPATQPADPPLPTATVGLSVVIPCFNEQAVLPTLLTELEKALEPLAASWEVILVDDGSRDGTFEEMTRLHELDPRCRVLSLSRNFGQQAAILAGLEHAVGSVVAILDADLQDPPHLLRRCLALIEEGYDVVYAVRKRRKEGFIARAAYAVFYRLLHYTAEIEIPVDSGDFCVLRRSVVDVILSMPERHAFVRGLRAWAGFRQIGIDYERPARAAGSSKYSLRRLVRLAGDGLFSFSLMPLRVATWAGAGVLLIGLVSTASLLVGKAFGRRLSHSPPEPISPWLIGWTVLLAFLGLQLLLMGILGEYVGRIYNEVKRRPRYVIRRSLGFGPVVCPVQPRRSQVSVDVTGS